MTQKKIQKMSWLVAVAVLVSSSYVSQTLGQVAQVGDTCSPGTFASASVCWSGKAANQDPLACTAGKCASTFAMGDTAFIEDGICFTDGIDPTSGASGTTRKCPHPRTACVNTTLWSLDDASRSPYNTGRCMELRLTPNFGNLVDKPCQVGSTTTPGTCWLGTAANISPLVCAAGVCKAWSSMPGIPAFVVDGPCFVDGVDPTGANRVCPAGSKCVSTLRLSDAVAFPFYADGRCIPTAGDTAATTAVGTGPAATTTTTAATTGSGPAQPVPTSGAVSVVATRSNVIIAMVSIVAWLKVNSKR